MDCLWFNESGSVSPGILSVVTPKTVQNKTVLMNSHFSEKSPGCVSFSCCSRAEQTPQMSREPEQAKVFNTTSWDLLVHSLVRCSSFYSKSCFFFMAGLACLYNIFLHFFLQGQVTWILHGCCSLGSYQVKHPSCVTWGGVWSVFSAPFCRWSGLIPREPTGLVPCARSVWSVLWMKKLETTSQSSSACSQNLHF